MRKLTMGAIGGALVLPAALLVAHASGRPPKPDGPEAVSDVAVLEWMAGCWLRETSTSVTEELWTQPKAGLMVGLSRTVGSRGRASFEHLLIEARGDTVVYRASPSGQATTEFVASHLSDTMAAFENPSHDFPRRIVYRQSSPDSLHARIAGPGDDETEIEIDFAYGRTACPSRTGGAGSAGTP